MNESGGAYHGLMSHDAPVNTMPTQAAGSLKPAPVVTIVFDVTSLERTAAFYGEFLGFRTVRTEREGLPYQTNVMTSDRHPGVALFARKTFQRPVSGACIGGVVQIGFRDPDLTRRIAELEGRVTWILAPGVQKSSDGETFRVAFTDPDGYVVELFR
jgi:catechol 2,3-dioxygenase-like lactoylglutathione lyase family enzyme